VILTGLVVLKKTVADAEQDAECTATESICDKIEHGLY
jgi:hypothetical protein